MMDPLFLAEAEKAGMDISPAGGEEAQKVAEFDRRHRARRARPRQGGLGELASEVCYRDTKWEGTMTGPFAPRLLRTLPRRARARDRRRIRAGLSDAAHQVGHLVPGRRPERRRRAHHRSNLVRAAGPAGHHREQARRRREPRHGVRARVGARWIHHSFCRAELCHQRDALREASLQFRQGQRAGCRDDAVDQRDGGASLGSGQDRRRVHRPCQGQSGQDQFCVGRRRHDDSHGGRAVQVDDRHRHRSRAVPRGRRRRSPTCSPVRCR